MRPSEAVPLVASGPDRRPVPPGRNYVPSQRGYLAPSYAGPSMSRRMRYEKAGALRGNRMMARDFTADARIDSTWPATRSFWRWRAVGHGGCRPILSESGGSGPQPEYVDGAMDGQMPDGEMMDGGMMDGEGCCQLGCGGCDPCDDCPGIGFCGFLRGCNECLKQTYLFSPCAWKNFSFYTGKQGFKNPTDLGRKRVTSGTTGA